MRRVEATEKALPIGGGEVSLLAVRERPALWSSHGPGAPRPSPRFGEAVALDRATIVVGAPSEDYNFFLTFREAHIDDIRCLSDFLRGTPSYSKGHGGRARTWRSASAQRDWWAGARRIAGAGNQRGWGEARANWTAAFSLGASPGAISP